MPFVARSGACLHQLALERDIVAERLRRGYARQQSMRTRGHRRRWRPRRGRRCAISAGGCTPSLGKRTPVEFEIANEVSHAASRALVYESGSALLTAAPAITAPGNSSAGDRQR